MIGAHRWILHKFKFHRISRECMSKCTLYTYVLYFHVVVYLDVHVRVSEARFLRYPPRMRPTSTCMW